MNKEFFDKAAACFPDSCFSTVPDLGIVLGSGWGDALEMDEVIARVSYADIAGLGASSVKGHAGEFIERERSRGGVYSLSQRGQDHRRVVWTPPLL